MNKLLKYTILFLCLNNQTVKAETVEKEFINKNHLGISLSNFMLKANYSRDLNKDYELGINAYYGTFSEYNFKYKTSWRFSDNSNQGLNLELNLKNNFKRKSNSIYYINYFIGSPIFKSYNRSKELYGDIYSFYFGSGLGLKLGGETIAFNAQADLGLAPNISYNSLAFILFPRLSLGLETNF